MIEAWVLGLVGALLYRVRGYDEVDIVSRQVERFLFTLLVIVPVLWNFASLEPLFLGLALLSFGTCLGGVVTGHGPFYLLWFNDMVVEKKVWLEAVLKFLPLDRNGGAYRSIGLALTGLLVTLIPGICYITLGGEVFTGLILAFSGLVKLPSYILGHLVDKTGVKIDFEKFFLKKGTQWGELFFGFSLMWIIGYNVF